MAGDLPDWTQAATPTAIHIATLTVAPGAAPYPITPPAGTQALGLAAGDNLGRIALSEVQGNPSGIVYWGGTGAQPLPLSGELLVVPVAFDPGFETGLFVDLQSSAPGNETVEVFALPYALHGVGQRPSRASVPVVVASDQAAIPVTNTQQGTASENLAQVGGTAVSLGQKVMTASVPVVVASDQLLQGRVRDLEPDFALRSTSSNGAVAATFTITPPGGKRVLIHRVWFDQAVPGGGTAAVNVCTVTGPTSGTLADLILGTSATVGDKDHAEAGPLLGAVNEVITVKSGLGGNAWTGCRASGWYV